MFLIKIWIFLWLLFSTRVHVLQVALCPALLDLISQLDSSAWNDIHGVLGYITGEPLTSSFSLAKDSADIFHCIMDAQLENKNPALKGHWHFRRRASHWPSRRKGWCKLYPALDNLQAFSISYNNCFDSK